MWWSSVCYLVERHTGEKHHHVDYLVHDNRSLKADDEEHAPADVDPVFDQHSHDHAAQNVHGVMLSSLLRVLLLYKTQQQTAQATISVNRCSDLKSKITKKKSKICFFLCYIKIDFLLG